MKLMAVAVLILIILSGCAGKQQPPTASPVSTPKVASAPAPLEPAVRAVSPAEIEQLIANASVRPYFLSISENGKVRYQVGVEPNGDCHMVGIFAHRGLANWVWYRPASKWGGPLWDEHMPQVPWTSELEGNCRNRLPGFDALRQFNTAFRQQPETGGTASWVATPDGQTLIYYPYEKRPIRWVQVDVAEVSGTLLPMGFRFEYGALDRDPAMTLTGEFAWGDARFPALPEPQGLGLVGRTLGSDKEDVEGPPNGHEFATHEQNPDGTVWARDPQEAVEVKYDRNNKVIVLRRIRGRLLNGLELGSKHGRPEAEQRLGKPTSTTDRELTYNYPGGYRLILELTNGIVTAARAHAPGY